MIPRRPIASAVLACASTLSTAVLAIAGTLAGAGTAGAQSSAAPSAVTAAPVLRTTGAFFALVVADIDATRTWYAEKFGLTVIMDATGDGGARAVVLSGGGLTVELVRQPTAVPLRTAAHAVAGALGVHGIFKVGMVIEDYDAAIDALRRRGVTFAMGPFPARDGQPANVILRDNEGNHIQLISR